MTLLTEPHTPGAGCCHCLLAQELTLHLSPQGSLLVAMMLEVAKLDAVLYVSQYYVYLLYLCTCVYLVVLGICHRKCEFVHTCVILICILFIHTVYKEL